MVAGAGGGGRDRRGRRSGPPGTGGPEVEAGAPARLLYDGACGVCRAFARLVRRLDPGGAVVPLPFTDPRAAVDLARLPPERREAGFHLVVAAGGVWTGEDAVLPTLRLLARTRRLAALLGALPGADAALRATYRWVAGHRALLGRLLGPALPTTAGARGEEDLRCGSRWTGGA